MKSETNKGGRPRKDSTEKKVHRVQVAMSDAEFAAAKRLAALLETSVSAAIATYAVPVSLRTKVVDTLRDRILHELTAAARRTAAAVLLSAEEGEQLESTDQQAIVDESQHMLIVHFGGSKAAHKVLQTSTARLYEDALSNYARSYAESMVFAASDSTQPELQPIPYSAERTAVLFSFAGESRIGRLYRYYEPLDWTD